MNKVVSTYSIDDRLRAQRVAPRALPAFPRIPPARDLSRDLIGTRTEIRQRGGLVPSWVIFTMIVTVTFAIAVSVNVRSHLELKNSTAQFQTVETQTLEMRKVNADLAQEVRLLQQSDPASVEAVARNQYGMVRPNEIVIPKEPR